MFLYRLGGLLNHVGILKFVQILPVINPIFGGIEAILLFMDLAKAAALIFTIAEWEQLLIVGMGFFSHGEFKDLIYISKVLVLLIKFQCEVGTILAFVVNYYQNF